MGNMLNRIQIFYAVLILTFLAICPALAEQVVVSIPSNLRTTPGAADVRVPINITDVTGLNVAGIDLKISYDTDVLTATGAISTGAITSESTTLANIQDAEGQIIIGITKIDGLAGSGVLIFIVFEVEVNQIANISPLSLLKASLNEGRVTVEKKDGQIVINRPPTANEQSVTTNEDTPVSIILTGQDVNGDTLTFTITSPPQNGILDGTSPHLTCIPNLNFFGTDSFRFKVSDGDEESDEATVTLIINSVNDQPTFTLNRTQVNVKEDFLGVETITVIPGTIPNNESSQQVTYSLSPTSVIFANVAINPNIGEITINPIENATGVQDFTITADDGRKENNTATQTFTLTVNAVNDAPVATNLSISPATPFTENNLTGSYTYSDVEGDTEGVSEIRWYKHNQLQAEYNNKKNVSSSDTSKGETWYFTVRPKDKTDSGDLVTSPWVTIGNTTPTAVLGDYTANEGEMVTLDGSSSYDIDNDIISYEWDLDNDGGYDDAIGITTSLNLPDNRPFTIGLKVTDNDGATSTTHVSITVNNLPPTINAGGGYTGDENQPIALTALFDDVPSDTVTIRWDLDDDGYYADAEGANATITFPDNGIYTVGVQASDEDGGISMDTATITVNNIPPEVDAGGAYTGNEDQPLTLTATASDVQADTITIRWDLDGDGLYDNVEGSIRTTTFPDNGVYAVGVQANDDDGGATTATATVTVNNLPPLAKAGGPYEGEVGKPIQLQGSAQDAPGDVDSLLYEWDLNYDGNLFKVDSRVQNPTVTYEVGAKQRNVLRPYYAVALRVTDKDGGVSALNLAMVHIWPPPNNPPVIAEIKPQVISEGEILTFNIIVVEPDGDKVTLAATNLPENATFTASTGEFIFKPNFEQAGEYNIRVTATEVFSAANGTPPLSHSIEVNITVKDVVNALVLSITPNLLKPSLPPFEKGQNFPYPPLGQGEEGGISTAQALATLISDGRPQPGANVIMTVQPEGMGFLGDVIDNGDGTYLATFNAGAISGEAMIIAEAPDIQVADKKKVTLDGDAPQITQVTGEAKANTGEVVKIVLKASDPSAPVSALIYVALFPSEGWESRGFPEGKGDTRLSHPKDVDGSEFEMNATAFGEFSHRIIAPIDSVKPIEYYIIVSDGLGNEAKTPTEGVYTLTIVDNVPPVAKAGPNQKVNSGQPVTFDGRRSTDNIGVVRYLWDVDDSDGIDFENPDLKGPNPTYKGYPPNLGDFGYDKYTVTLRVYDAAGNYSDSTLIVEVPDTIPPYVVIDPITSPTNSSDIIITGVVRRSEDGLPEAGDTVSVMLNGIVQNTAASGDDGRFSLEITDLTDGVYLITSTAADSYGNISEPAVPMEIIVDTTPPILTGFTPVDGSTVTAKRPTFSATLFDELSGIASEKITMSSSVGTQTFTLNPAFDETTGALSCMPDTDLINGTNYTVSVEVEDRVGNPATANWRFTVDLFAEDTEPPVFSSFIPEDGSTITERQPLISAFAIDPGGIQSSSVSITLKDSGNNPVALIGFEFDTSISIMSAKPESPLTDDIYTVTIVGKDSNDNRGEANFNFTVDATPPQPPAIVQPDTPTKQTKLTLMGTAEPASTVNIYLNGNPVATITADVESPILESENPPFGKGGLGGIFAAELTLVEGMNDITATASDAPGNTSLLSTPVFILLDTRAPIISNLQPSAITGTLTPMITASVVDPASSKSSPFSSGIDFDSIDVLVDEETITKFDYDISTGVLSYRTPPFEDNTQHTVKVRCSDVAGNAATPSMTIFLVDTVVTDKNPPSVSFSVDEGDVLTKSQPTFTLAFSDTDSGIADSSIAILLDGVEVEIPSLEGAFEEPEKVVTFTPSTPLEDGEHAISVSVSDNAGNAIFDAVNFLVKTKVTIPTFDELPPFVADEFIAISGIAEPTSTVKVYVNNIPAGTTKTSEEGKFIKENVKLAPGMNVLTAEAADEYGNISNLAGQSHAATIKEVGYDAQPPKVSNFNPHDGAILNETPSFSVVLSDSLSGVSPESLVLFLDGTQMEPIYNDGKVSYSSAYGELEEGRHSIVLYVEDNVGNPLLVNWQFTLDTTTPDISAIVPGDGSVISNVVPTLSAAMDDNFGVDWSSLHLSLNDEGLTGFNYNPVSGLVSYQIQEPLQDGVSYIFTVTIADTAGNVSIASSNFSVDTAQTDRTPPSFANQNPPNETSINLLLLSVISVAIFDGDTGVNWNSIAVFINGFQIPAGQLLSVARFNRTTNRLIINVRKLRRETENSLQLGENTIRVVTEDKSGNESQTEWSFYVVTDSPGKPTLTPIQSPTNSLNVDVTGMVKDSAVDSQLSVTLLVNGLDVKTTPVEADGSFTVNNVSLRKGDNTITAYATDIAGNQSEISEPLYIQVDRRPPEVNFLTADIAVQPETLITGEVDEPLGKLEIIFNGEQDAVGLSGLMFEWVATLKEGENTIQFEALDLAGNITTTERRSIYLDTVPPTQKPTELRGRIWLDGRSVLLNWKAPKFVFRDGIRPLKTEKFIFRDGIHPLKTEKFIFRDGIHPLKTEKDAVKFNIYRADSHIGGLENAGLLAMNIDGTEYRDNTIRMDTTYFYAVTPLDVAGNEGAISDSTAVQIFRAGGASIEYPELTLFKLNGGLLPSVAPTFKYSISLAPINIDSVVNTGALLLAFKATIYGQDGISVERLDGEATISTPIPTDIDLHRFMPTLYYKEGTQWLAAETQRVDAVRALLTAQVSQLGDFAIVSVPRVKTFNLNLNAGLNLFSVPVNDPKVKTLADLMQRMGDYVRFIAKYDTEEDKFVVFFPGDQRATQIPISGSEGYLASLKEATTLNLEGYAWDGIVSIHKGINLIAMPVKSADTIKLSHLMTKFGDAITLMV